MPVAVGSNAAAMVVFMRATVGHSESKEEEEEHWYYYSVRVGCSANASYSLVWWLISIERASLIVLVTSY